MQYCIDTNVFIQAYQKYYAFDIAPGFWKGLSDWAEKGEICSPINVYDEIIDAKDPLADWVKACKSNLFIVPDDNIGNAFSEVADYVVSRYEPQHVREFLSVADPWVIASAIAMNTAVVTLEELKTENSSTVLPGCIAGKIKIPNVCKQFNVRHINTFNFVRELKIPLR